MAPERVLAPDRPSAASTTRPVRPGRTAAWLAKQVEIGLSDTGLTLPQYRVLSLLDEGPAVSSAVARRLAVRPPSVTGIVDGLVAKGLVARTNDADDRRCISLDVTEDGRRVLDQADDDIESRLEYVAEGLKSSAERNRAMASLSLWNRALSTLRDRSGAGNAR